MLVAEVTPATAQLPPSASSNGPPESPEHTALPLDVFSVSSTVPPTAVTFAVPARSVSPPAPVASSAPAGDDGLLTHPCVAAGENRLGCAREILAGEDDPDVER